MARRRSDAIAGRDGVHGLVGGRAARLLLDAGALDAADAARRLLAAPCRSARRPAARRRLDRGLPGRRRRSLLVHDDALLGVLDDWVAGVAEDAFNDVLPLLRRAFSTVRAGRAAADRRARRARGAGAARRPWRPATSELDHERAALVLPLLRGWILGR